MRLVGSPSAVATFNPNIWYYISENAGILCAFLKPVITEQKVIQVTFNESGRIAGDQELRPEGCREHRHGPAHHADLGQGTDGARADPGQRRQVHRPARTPTNPGAPTGGGGSEARQASPHPRSIEKAPVLSDRGFSVAFGVAASVREDGEQQQGHDVGDLDHRVDGRARPCPCTDRRRCRRSPPPCGPRIPCRRNGLPRCTSWRCPRHRRPPSSRWRRRCR